MSSKILLQKIFYKALKNVQAKTIIRKNVSINGNSLHIVDQNIPLKSFKNLYIFSVGKAGYDMAKEAENILGSHIKGGVAISLKHKKLSYINTCQSSHPKVSAKSFNCATQMMKELQNLRRDDLFLFFLSGGASAMIEKPIGNLSLEEFQKISDALLVSGVDIKALNTVRKSISTIKGGKLADVCSGQGYVLVLSDVIGDDLKTIGSAPMLNEKFPHYIIGNNKIALDAAKSYIKNHVEKTKILTTSLDTSSKKAAKYLCNEIKKYDREYGSFCLLVGGETTLQVKGNGIGGRNSELALRLLTSKCITENISILCAGSDGVDGNSNANGAFVEYELLSKSKKQKLDPKIYLKNNDSATFFQKLGSEFITGLTGTNVMDFVIILKQTKRE